MAVVKKKILCERPLSDGMTAAPATERIGDRKADSASPVSLDQRYSPRLVVLSRDTGYFGEDRENLSNGTTDAFVDGVKRFEETICWGWPMKLKNIFRTHVVAIGFAAASLLAGTAPAQEIDNTVWRDSADVEVFRQPARVAVVNKSDDVATSSAQTETQSATAQPILSQEAIVFGGTVREGWLIGMSILLMSPAAVLVLSKVRRARYSTTVRAYHDKRSNALY